MSGEAIQERNHNRFIRQRRNLILVSLFLLFYKIGQLELTQVNILGNEVIIHEPNIVFWAMLTFFFYFQWRYFTACNDVIGVRLCKAGYLSILDKAARKKAYKILQGRIGNIDQIELSQNRHTHFSVKRITNRPYEEQELIKKQGSFNIAGFGLLATHIKAISYYALNDNTFSEYLFPYLLALAAIIAIIWN